MTVDIIKKSNSTPIVIPHSIASAFVKETPPLKDNYWCAAIQLEELLITHHSSHIFASTISMGLVT